MKTTRVRLCECVCLAVKLNLCILYTAIMVAVGAWMWRSNRKCWFALLPIGIWHEKINKIDFFSFSFLFLLVLSRLRRLSHESLCQICVLSLSLEFSRVPWNEWGIVIDKQVAHLSFMNAVQMKTTEHASKSLVYANETLVHSTRKTISMKLVCSLQTHTRTHIRTDTLHELNHQSCAFFIFLLDGPAVK